MLPAHLATQSACQRYCGEVHLTQSVTMLGSQLCIMQQHKVRLHVQKPCLQRVRQ